MRRTFKILKEGIPTYLKPSIPATLQRTLMTYSPKIGTSVSQTSKSLVNQTRLFYKESVIKTIVDNINKFINKEAPLPNIQNNLKNKTRNNRSKNNQKSGKTGRLYDFLKFLHRFYLYNIFSILALAGLYKMIAFLDKEKLLEMTNLLPEKTDITENALSSSYIQRTIDGKYYFKLRQFTKDLITAWPSASNIGSKLQTYSVRVETIDIEKLIPLLENTTNIENFKATLIAELINKKNMGTITESEEISLNIFLELEKKKIQAEKDVINFMNKNKKRNSLAHNYKSVGLNTSKNIASRMFVQPVINELKPSVNKLAKDDISKLNKAEVLERLTPLIKQFELDASSKQFLLNEASKINKAETIHHLKSLINKTKPLSGQSQTINEITPPISNIVNNNTKINAPKTYELQ